MPPLTPEQYDALIRSDVGYTTSVGDIIRRRIAAAIQYGSASSVPGMDAETAAAARANPNSTLAQLLRQHALQNAAIGNTANSRGGLFSGGYAQGIANEAQAATQRASAAGQSLQNYLSSLTSEESGAYADAYARLAANPPGLGDAAATDAAAAAAAGGAPPGSSPRNPAFGNPLQAALNPYGRQQGPASIGSGVTSRPPRPFNPYARRQWPGSIGSGVW